MNILADEVADKTAERDVTEEETKILAKTSENADLIKTAVIFGQSEDELRREFKEFKFLKLLRKVYCDLTLSPDEAFDDELSRAAVAGFGGVVVFPTRIRRAKTLIGGADVKVIAAVCYPFGEECGGVKKTAIKKVSAYGADGVLLPIGLAAIKGDNLDFIRRDVKKCLKVNKSLKITALAECGECTGEEVERVVKVLSACGVKSFCTGSGYLSACDAAKTRCVRAGAAADAEIIATDKIGNGGDVINLLRFADKVITVNCEKVADDIRSRIG